MRRPQHMTDNKSGVLATLVLVAGLAACGTDGPNLVERTSSLSQTLCACKTLACAEPHIARIKRLTVEGSSKLDELSDRDSSLLLKVQLNAALCEKTLRRAAEATGQAPAPAPGHGSPASEAP